MLNSDEDMLALPLGTLVKRYPDVTHEQIVCLLLLRGDKSRQEARDIASGVVSEEKNNSDPPLHAPSILSQVQVTSSLNPFAGKDIATDVTSRNPFATKD